MSEEPLYTGDGRFTRSIVERVWHMQDSQGQILAFGLSRRRIRLSTT